MHPSDTAVDGDVEGDGTRKSSPVMRRKKGKQCAGSAFFFPIACCDLFIQVLSKFLDKYTSFEVQLPQCYVHGTCAQAMEL